jgi:hypothetical protein
MICVDAIAKVSALTTEGALGLEEGNVESAA